MYTGIEHIATPIYTHIHIDRKTHIHTVCVYKDIHRETQTVIQIHLHILT